MRLEDQVVCLDLSMKLKKLGVNDGDNMKRSITYYDESGINSYTLSSDGVNGMMLKNERGDFVKIHEEDFFNGIFDLLDKYFKEKTK